MTLPIGYVVRTNQGAVAAMADDTVGMFSPLATPASSKIAQDHLSQTAFEVAQNLALADDVLNRSWKDSPKGANADIDAMRQRLQNLVDLQRSLLAKYYEVIQQQHSPCLQASDAHDAYCLREATTSQALTIEGVRTLMRAGFTDQLITPSEASDPSKSAQRVAHDVSRYGTVADVDKELTLQELAFDKEAQAAATSCGL